METRIPPERLQDPDVRESERILRTCVHCGFCTATCPTYVLLGNELDGPRGRIYLIKRMLEEGRVTEAVVRHVDRCLSCLSCMTTCPSGVHYMHLVDHARAVIERDWRRPWPERLLRAFVATVLPDPHLFRLALLAGLPLRPLARLWPGRLGAMLRQQPARLPPPSWVDRPQTIPARGRRVARVAVLPGCAQQVLAPEINEATVRLLHRMGVEVVVPPIRCCGALTHHMGRSRAAHRTAARAIRAWMAAHRREPLDAIVVNATGCGTPVKDYGFVFREDPELAEDAATVSRLARDLGEFVAALGSPPAVRDVDLAVAWHAPCSLQHGQRLAHLPRRLLADAGFLVREPAEAHLCCGSAGTYSIFQPQISERLQRRKAERLAATGADLVATANIGCLLHIRAACPLPVVHWVELLDWASGGPRPPALTDAGRGRGDATPQRLPEPMGAG